MIKLHYKIIKIQAVWSPNPKTAFPGEIKENKSESSSAWRKLTLNIKTNVN